MHLTKWDLLKLLRENLAVSELISSVQGRKAQPSAPPFAADNVKLVEAPSQELTKWNLLKLLCATEVQLTAGRGAT